MYMSRGTGVAARVRPESRRSRLELAIAPSAVRIARHWTAEQLALTDPPHSGDLIDAAVLLVSELVTNAIQAVGQVTAASTTLSGTVAAMGMAAGRVLPLGGFPAGAGLPGPAVPPGRPRVCLVISRLAETVRIEVHDSSCVPLPPTCHRDADDEHGRGLTVVAALAANWGWRPDACGKVVWCDLANEP